MTRIHCPHCKCELLRTERLMVLGVNRPMAGAARKCPQCGKWYPLGHKLGYVRFRPVFTFEAVAAREDRSDFTGIYAPAGEADERGGVSMIFEIVNPSDMYTIEADSFELACTATCILGEGAYSLIEIDGDNEMPLFFFGGHNEWFEKTFGHNFTQSLELFAPEQIAVALDSVLIGGKENRQTYRDGLELIDDPAKREEWRRRWHDERRSSLNDIGGRAYAIAKALKERATL